MPVSLSPSISAEATLTAILNMAFDFSSMGRVLKSGTKEQFLSQVRKLTMDLGHVNDPGAFDVKHEKFCAWGIRTIKTSKTGTPSASYGQVAKTLNVMLKVVVYYCNLPSEVQARTLTPYLHPAIDTEMMKYLRKKHRQDFPVQADSIANVSKKSYQKLLTLAHKDIRENYCGALYPVQWEDILWATLNKKQGSK